MKNILIGILSVIPLTILVIGSILSLAGLTIILCLFPQDEEFVTD